MTHMNPVFATQPLEYSSCISSTSFGSLGSEILSFKKSNYFSHGSLRSARIRCRSGGLESSSLLYCRPCSFLFWRWWFSEAVSEDEPRACPVLQNNWFAYLIQNTLVIFSVFFRVWIWWTSEAVSEDEPKARPVLQNNWFAYLIRSTSKHFVIFFLILCGDDDHQRLFLRMSLKLAPCCKITDLPIWSEALVKHFFLFSFLFCVEMMNIRGCFWGWA